MKNDFEIAIDNYNLLRRLINYIPFNYDKIYIQISSDCIRFMTGLSSNHVLYGFKVPSIEFKSYYTRIYEYIILLNPHDLHISLRPPTPSINYEGEYSVTIYIDEGDDILYEYSDEESDEEESDEEKSDEEESDEDEKSDEEESDKYKRPTKLFPFYNEVLNFRPTDKKTYNRLVIEHSYGNYIVKIATIPSDISPTILSYLRKNISTCKSINNVFGCDDLVRIIESYLYI
jgi:hypothetical protein